MIKAAQTIRRAAYLCSRCQCSVIAKHHMQKLIDALAALDADKPVQKEPAMETPEQRRERLARIIDGSAFIQLELMGPGQNDIVSRWSFKERIKSAYAIADAIIASDEAAGMVVVVPKSECADLASLRERLDVLLAKMAKE